MFRSSTNLSSLGAALCPGGQRSNAVSVLDTAVCGYWLQPLLGNQDADCQVASAVYSICTTAVSSFQNHKLNIHHLCPEGKSRMWMLWGSGHSVFGVLRNMSESRRVSRGILCNV